MVHDRTCEAVATTTCKPELGREIMALLQNRPICGAMFRQSCFGDYVNMPMGVERHPLLYHYIMFKEANTFDLVDLEELLFPIGNYRIWVLETFSNSSIDGSPISGVIPRSIAYTRMRHLHAPDCQCILDLTNAQLPES
uniref:Uncharacterized protein n=1 Tax=Lactuca sativa TaxID=4236 RepID=A0A9R1XT42_LACSA|nr:hypothetical protein LSAT_V11C100026680 [Lactuca sativa]